MTNKKGFTLVELLAVIAIISILLVIVTPAFLTVRKDLLKSTLKTKISNINNAAKDYAEDHLKDIPSHVEHEITNLSNINKNVETDCLTIYVRVLIYDGYITGDDEEKKEIINPLTNESLNDLIVCMRYDTNDALNRSIVTYIIGEDDLIE